MKKIEEKCIICYNFLIYKNVSLQDFIFII